MLKRPPMVQHLYNSLLAGANQRVQIPTVAGLPPAVIIGPVVGSPIGSSPKPPIPINGLPPEAAIIDPVIGAQINLIPQPPIPMIGFNNPVNAGGQPAPAGGGSAIDPIITPVAGSQPNQNPPTTGGPANAPAPTGEIATNSSTTATTDPVIDQPKPILLMLVVKLPEQIVVVCQLF
jgi:hypothetical protein